MKSFKFQLEYYELDGFDTIALSKLEDKDAKDIATLVTNHYGSKDALKVTQDILKKINQRKLFHQLEHDEGKTFKF